ncbi:hypothetical protein GCM10027347_44680 [Larkinella harenae]
MLVFNRDISPYLQQCAGGNAPGGALLHQYYPESVKHKKAINEVFGEKYPRYLNINRPKEREEHKKFRKEVFEQQGNPFLGLRSQVINAFDYIRQADDFDIQFPTTEIDEEHSLKNYMTSSSFSPEGGAVNWFFKEFAPDYVNDPNAVFLILPEQLPESDLLYTEPKFLVIPSENVFMHRKGKFAVLMSPERHFINVNGVQKQEGITLYFVDHDSYSIARQMGRFVNADSGRKEANWQVLGHENIYDELGRVVGSNFLPPRHYCEMMPAFKLGKKRAKKNNMGEELHVSILSDSLPYVRKAQQIDNDIFVELSFHIASQEWRRATGRCGYPGCTAGVIVEREDDGSGHIKDVKECPKCKGTGYNSSGSGLELIWVTGGEDEDFGGGSKAPNGAPGGYIPRSIEPLKELVQELKRNTEEAYATMNMQFIRVTPLATSGTSKRYDREEFYRELNTQADHILELLEEGYKCADAIRFAPSGRAGEQIPKVLRPVRFNLENAELTREELNNAKDKKYDSALVSAYEIKMLQYTTGEQSDHYRRYMAKTKFDPHRTLTYQEKLLQTNEIFTKMKPEDPKTRLAISELHFSVNFEGLVSRALREDPDFWLKDDKQQYETLQRYNEDLIGELRPAPMAKEEMPPTTQMKVQPGVDLENVTQTVEQ